MRTTLPRKDFIRQSAGALAALCLSPYGDFNKAPVRNLSFSTLACPTWDLKTIIGFAAANGYNGVELRVVAGELDLPALPEFSAGKIAATRRMIADKGIRIVDIGSSAQMHHRDPAELQKNMTEAKRFVNLAHQLECKYMRVFPEKLLPGEEKKASLDTIAENLRHLGDFVQDSGVKVLIESHGDLVNMNDLALVMKNCNSSNTGMIWDIVNMWSVTRQPPAEVFKKLQTYICHVHVKDMRFVDGKEQYTLVGKGEAPVKEAVKALSAAGYKGFYSFEWEKLWHPELAGPELALAAYPGEINKYF